MDKDPIQEVEEILEREGSLIAAEQIKVHGEMLLLSSLHKKSLVTAQLLLKAATQGADYLTGLAVAVGLTARTWGRILADDPDVKFEEYSMPESEALCECHSGFAHYLCREILTIQDVPKTDAIRAELKEWIESHTQTEMAELLVHLIAMYADLLDAVLDIRNGDFLPKESGE